MSNASAVANGVPDDKLRLADCGSIYDVALPKHNVSKAPTVWQSFDIEFHPPEYLDARKTADASVTLVHNEVKILDDARVARPTASALPGDASGPGPILFICAQHPTRLHCVGCMAAHIAAHDTRSECGCDSCAAQREWGALLVASGGVYVADVRNVQQAVDGVRMGLARARAKGAA